LRTRQRKDQRCDGKEQAALVNERTRETESLGKGYDSGISETTDILPALDQTQDPEERQHTRNRQEPEEKRLGKTKCLVGHGISPFSRVFS